MSSITYACANGADIVNGSFGGSGASMTVRDAILSAPCANTLFVFAAGNSGWDLDSNTGFHDQAYPCEFHRPPAEGGASAANILCVGATDRNDVLASFSNRGTSAVHLAAPGVDILSAAPGVLERRRFPENFEGTVAQFNARWGNRMPNPNPWNRTSVDRTGGAFSITDSPVGLYIESTDTAISKLAPFSLAGRTGCRIDYNMRIDTDNNVGSSPSTDDIFWIIINGSPFSGWSGSTFGDWFAFFDDFSTGRRHGCSHDRARARCRQRQLPWATGSTSTTLTSTASTTRQRVPVPRRNLDGDAARRRRRGAAPGATTRP